MNVNKNCASFKAKDFHCENICENYKPKETEAPEWTNCKVTVAVTYSNDGSLGRDHIDYPRLGWFVKGDFDERRQITRAGFQTLSDAELFLAALPEEER